MLKKLKIYCEVAKVLNMSEVSKKEYISQPAISQIIKELEQNFNQVFFERGKKLKLTHAGKIFFEYAVNILNLYAECGQRLNELNNLERGFLKIGASTTIGIYVLPNLIKKFKRKYPNVEFSILVDNTSHILNSVKENEIDFAIVEADIEEKNIITKCVMEDELVFISGQKKPPVIKYDKLNNYKLILREKGSGTRKVFEEFMLKENIKYQIAFELGNTEAIKKAVEALNGMSCVSLRTVINEKNIYISRLEKPIKRNFNLIYRKNKYFTNTINEFLKELI